MKIKIANLRNLYFRRTSILALFVVFSACLLQLLPADDSIITTLTARLIPLTAKKVWIRPAPNSPDSQKIALHLSAILETKGAKVVIANKAQTADICLNIYTGTDIHPDCQSINTYYHPQAKAGRQLALQIQDSLLTLDPKTQRPARSGAYYVLKNSKFPAVIIEIGYKSSQIDNHLDIAKAIARGVENYFALLKQPPQAVPRLPQKSATVIKTQAEKCNLYFIKHDAKSGQDILALEQRTLSKAVATSVSNASTQRVITKANLALEQLAQGPESPALESALPKGTKSLWCKLKDDTLTINFNKAFIDNFQGSLHAENLCLLSIVKTVCQFEPIKQVQILVQGRRHPTLAGNIDLTSPVSLKQLEAPAFVAIVIDDLGGSYAGTNALLKLTYPLTLAVMPNLESSSKEAKAATSHGHEVIIHMPMEAANAQPQWYGPEYISTDMKHQEIQQIIEEALEQMPQAKGLSNHMGSKATSHQQTMQLLLQTLKKRDLFVFDSRTTLDTVIPSIAQTLKLPYAERTVFLDNSGSLEAIQAQLDLLGQKALQQGYAIGIGHVGTYGDNMAKALREKLPQLEAQGIVIVPLSELLVRP